MSDERDAEFPIAWALFAKLELAAEGDLDDVAEFYDAAVAEIGEAGLLRGWAIVAALLRHHLVQHASKLGCGCGSDDWLGREQLHHAEDT